MHQPSIDGIGLVLLGEVDMAFIALSREFAWYGSILAIHGRGVNSLNMKSQDFFRLLFTPPRWSRSAGLWPSQPRKPLDLSMGSSGAQRLLIILQSFVPKTLEDRIHACPSCGRTGDRDVVAADRVHLRTFGQLTQARGQRDCERGEHKSYRAKRLDGESAIADFRVPGEAKTSQASWEMGKTSGGKPTEADETSLALESENPFP